MAIKGKLTEEFLAGIKEIESILYSMHFHPHSFEEKGAAYFIKYKRGQSIVEFLFGPSDWHVEMLIFTSKRKFSFGDLLQIPAIAGWVRSNEYKPEKTTNVKGELLWFVELLKVSLPIIE